MPDRTRTGDLLDHNQAFYQLNYGHHLGLAGCQEKAVNSANALPYQNVSKVHVDRVLASGNLARVKLHLPDGVALESFSLAVCGND